jgi:hypothetical protein
MSTTRVEAPNPRTRTRRWRVLALFVLASTVLAVLAVELLARFVFPKLANDRSYFDIIDRRIFCSFPTLDPKAHEKFGSVLSPNAEKICPTDGFDYTIRTNSLGFRTREIEPRKPGEWRVMLVGDSFFQGAVHLEDNVAMQLEQCARQAKGLVRPLAVYNFAVEGYTTVQELIVTRTYAPAVKPDQLIVGFLAANDVIPNAVTSIDANDNLVINQDDVQRVQADVRSRIGWLRHSMIFRALSVSPYTTRLYYEIAREPAILERTYAVFEQLKEYCARNQIALTIVFMHCKDGVRGGLHGAWTQSAPVTRTLYDYCRSHGIDAVDMIDYVHGSHDVNTLYYRIDGHPNAGGCRRIAEVIFDTSIVSRLRTPAPDESRADPSASSGS